MADLSVFGKARSLSDYIVGNQDRTMQMAQTQAQMQAQQLAAQKAKSDMAMQLLSGAADEPSYQMAKQKAASIGYDVSGLPQNFDPRVVSAIQNQALTPDQRASLDIQRLGQQRQLQMLQMENNHFNQQMGMEQKKYDADQAYRGQEIDMKKQMMDLRAKLAGMGGQYLDPETGQMIDTQRKLSPTEQKELFSQTDVIDKAQSANQNLNDALSILQNGDPYNKGAKPYTGTGASLRAAASRLPLLGDVIADTDKGGATASYNQLVSQQVLDNFRAIFGARPAEMELRYLQKLQALSDYSPEQQKAILQEGMQLAKRRETNARVKASAINSGNYRSLVDQNSTQSVLPDLNSKIPSQGATDWKEYFK